jgi:alkaline phosphatase D
MTEVFSRRQLIQAAAVAGTALVAAPGRAPAFIRSRPLLTHGIQSGDVRARSGIVWARADRPSRMLVEVATRPGGRHARLIEGPVLRPEHDFTGKVRVGGLPPGREIAYRVTLEDLYDPGLRSEPLTGSFRTASRRRRDVSVIWSADIAGQGWGINPDLGGMTAYATMLATRPDFFVHAGDTVYADGPISETVTEPDGQVWRNLVIPEVTKVAETLAEFRGRHRYNLMDDNVRAMYAEVPVLAQWDDHETTNNWYPGEVLDDPRYTERRVDVLAARGRRAWQEYQPIATGHVRGRGSDGFAEARIYRKVGRGAHLDVFCLDMRTHKSTNTANTEQQPTPILGRAQTEWLVRELRRSDARWKVISADLPIGIVVPDGAAQEGVANADGGQPLGREHEIAQVLSAIKRYGVRNVVWITADVHYCAAHHYSPERAAYTDFDPFWELVAGPINAGTFGPNAMDGTFGPEVVFSRSADYPNQSPRGGHQFFGHVAIDEAGLLTASLRDSSGAVLWSRDLEPAAD